MKTTHSTSFRIFFVLVCFLLLKGSIAVSQQSVVFGDSTEYNTAWWYSILQKHQITPAGFNGYPDLFEMGTKNSITNQVVTLENAFFLFRPTGKEYYILRSPLAYHDLKANVIECSDGTMESFFTDSREIQPVSTMQFKELRFELSEGKQTWRAEKMSMEQHLRKSSKAN
jgi:hypothetical protein